MSDKTKILFIDDDANFRKVTAYALTREGYEVVTARQGREGLALLADSRPDVVICDLRMPVMDGMEFLREKRKTGDTTPVLVLTAFGSIENAVEAMREGAVDYLTKPLNRDELHFSLKRTLEHEGLRQANRALRERVATGKAADRLIGTSQEVQDLRDSLGRLAESDAPVLLRGESGSGKELAARALHFDGPRAETGQFVVLNCAAIPGELLESELFGHRKGSFTGAIRDHMGKFEAADRGTLFLDEIGDMPLALQAKLLRALQEGEITPIGENAARKVNVRVVAATNQPLDQKIREGTFRQDLFYRLAVVVIDLPPLRVRCEDLGILIRHFLARYGAPEATVTDEALEALKRHDWPGNVRELENVISRACAYNPRLEQLEPKDLPPQLRNSEGALGQDLWDDRPLRLPEEGVQFDEIERKLLAAAWEQSEHNQTRGAELLGLPRQAFIYRLQKHGLLPEYGKAKSAESEE